MLPVIRHIDEALKRLYNLSASYRAEDFLIAMPASAPAVGNAQLRGALFVRGSREQDDVEMGIYLSEPVRELLGSLAKPPATSTPPSWTPASWTLEQLDAFMVAAEEISHFHYLVHHAEHGRGVSQLELELQGEVDKFLITFFARRASPDGAERLFEALYDQLFGCFRLHPGLSPEARQRYLDANRLGARFIHKCQRWLVRQPTDEKDLGRLRRFYRLSSAEKMSVIAA